jgi:hypothetical protein
MNGMMLPNPKSKKGICSKGHRLNSYPNPEDRNALGIRPTIMMSMSQATNRLSHLARRSLTCGASLLVTGVSLVIMGAPHFGQNFASALISAPHLAQDGKFTTAELRVKT